MLCVVKIQETEVTGEFKNDAKMLLKEMKPKIEAIVTLILNDLLETRCL